MQIAIVGTGAIGLAYCSFLMGARHDVRIYSPRGSLARGSALQCEGLFAGTFDPLIWDSLAEAVTGAEIVIVAIPGPAYQAVLGALAESLVSSQVIVFSGQLPLGALYLSKRLSERGQNPLIISLAAPVFAGRREGGKLNVIFRRPAVDISCMPAAELLRAVAVCTGCFGDCFVPMTDTLAVSIANLNPPIHLANSLLNFTRIERGEGWANYDGITRFVGNLIEALDEERHRLADALGLSIVSARDDYVRNYDVVPGEIHEMTRQIHEQRNGPKGPTSTDTRYVIEDIPYGIVPLKLFAEVAGVGMPLHSAGIDLFSAMYDRDFCSENEIAAELGIGGLAMEAVLTLHRDGWPPP